MMSTPGRGRGYTGRHHLREPRPGDAELSEELEAVRTLAELSPRSTDPRENKDKREMEPPGESRERAAPDELLAELLTVEEQYAPLLTLLEQFSPGEDGIQFNRKLRQFEATVTNMCPDESRLHQAFSTFRAAALLNSVTARKLAAVGASFTRQQRQQLLRGALLNVVMQGTYSKLDILERANPLYLINAANLMGDYFAEARLCNGNKVHILAVPLLQYMRALLASDDIRAHRSLATQLMQNGREILSVHAQELDELSISIRLRLLTPPPVSIIWLLLSADLCLNKFLPLPNTLQQFYAAHLELNSDENYSEVSYGSWRKTSPEQDDYKSDHSSDLSTEKVGQSLSQVNLNHSDDSKPKLRPILGAGAGLLRQEQALSVGQDNFDTWTTKNSLSKRYDLNSWRQNEEEKEESEPVFNPTVLPPNFPNVTHYPPPNQYNYPEEFPNYLQQGDGTYIQNQYNNINYNQSHNFPYQERQGNNEITQVPHMQDLGNNEHGQPNIQNRSIDQLTHFPERGNTEAPHMQEQSDVDRAQEMGNNERPVLPHVERSQIPERVNNEIQKNSNRRPVENWRQEKSDLKEDPNRNRQRNWTRQRSKDSLNDDEDQEKFKERSASRSSRDSKPSNRLSRRNSGDSVDTTASGKTPQRKHVSDVPRNHKYWDHDDRCDKDYNS